MTIVCLTDKLFCNRKSFVWPNNYVLQKLLWKQNHDLNENFKATIKVGAYIFLRWYLKKKNCKHKYRDVKVKSLKQRATVGLLLKPGPGPWKTWNLKQLDPEKLVINMSLKNKCLPLESLIKKICNLICS